MKVGCFTPLLSALPLEQVLKKLKSLGIDTVEFGTGNYPGDAHAHLSMLDNPAELQTFKSKIADAGMTISALSSHGNPLHPDKAIARKHAETSRKTILLCEKLGVPGPVVCQPYYNLLNRMPEVEILPACAHFGLGVVPYSPIARGVLTGKYAPGQAPAADTRAGRGDKRIMDTEFREESLKIAQELVTYCSGKGVKPGHFATAWVLANPVVTSVIAGPRTLAQMQDYYGALDVTVDAKEEAMVDDWVTPGHASTHGYNDPSYPFFGRPV